MNFCVHMFDHKMIPKNWNRFFLVKRRKAGRQYNMLWLKASIAKLRLNKSSWPLWSNCPPHTVTCSVRCHFKSPKQSVMDRQLCTVCSNAEQGKHCLMSEGCLCHSANIGKLVYYVKCRLIRWKCQKQLMITGPKMTPLVQPGSIPHKLPDYAIIWSFSFANSSKSYRNNKCETSKGIN